MGETDAEVSFRIPAPLPVVIGQSYRMRLVLSQGPGAPWKDTIKDVFHFDTSTFVIDEPPTGGIVTMVPSEGEATLTLFNVNTKDWVVDDLPLEYRFSWLPAKPDPK